MRRLRIGSLGAALWLVAGLASASPAPARALSWAPVIENLRIVEGGGWSPVNRFHLAWDFKLPAGVTEEDVVSVKYKLENPHAVRWPPVPVEGSLRQAQNLRIAPPVGGSTPVPGVYPLEIWGDGTIEGPHVRTELRFDDKRPGAATPELPAGWIRGDVDPVLRIAHPAGRQPVSGIRGYAFSIRPGAAEPPCGGPDLCSPAETDLDGGIGDDTLALGLRAEGVHVLSVVAVTNSGLRSPHAETAVLKVDATRPDLRLSGGGEGWVNHPVRVVAKAFDPLSGMAAAGPGGPRTSIWVDGGAPTTAQGDEAAAVVAGSGVHTVLASARDGAGNARGEDAASPPVLDRVRIDEAAPSVSFSPGVHPGEPERIEALVTDALSGPAAGRGSIAVRPLGSGQPFEPIPTEDRGGLLVAHWDSDAYPRGSYEFRATAYDVAGNSTASGLRSDAAPMVLANPIKVPVAIEFGFGGERLVWHRCTRAGESRRCRRQEIEPFERRPATRIVPYGRGLQVGGRLLSASGAPLVGYPVEVVESFDAGATARPRTTTLTTGADGLFVALLRPGPSRRVEARFGGNRVLTRAGGRSLRLGVRTAVRLRASSARAAIGGAPVLFSGQVPHLEAAIPAYGRPVQFQFRLPGQPWTEFRTVQTDAQGRFRFPYSFTDDDSRGVRFLFRAYAPPQPGWPYEPGVSKPLAVTGY